MYVSPEAYQNCVIVKDVVWSIVLLSGSIVGSNLLTLIECKHCTLQVHMRNLVKNL